MRLINVKAFLEREQVLSKGGRVDRRTKVLEFRNYEATEYAILSHRWIDPTEVDYEEMIDLAKMKVEDRDEIRRRLGYKKILDSCEQAKKDEYKYLWVDTCCIDKRSSAELSEAINSMYRWYENSMVCYAYLHDVFSSTFPDKKGLGTYPNSVGWPEWFSRGWTLQEMIALRVVHFFNKDWQLIGEKRTLAHALSFITRVPEHILRYGLSSDRPCVAQIMSWSANRTTTRVEDRAYSLMGLLDVNMPMLYGEGKKAFHRLQLEVIHMSNDQSILVWKCDTAGGRNGSILADDPSFFWGCNKMELMDPNEFIQSLKGSGVPEEELHSIEEDHFGVFPITNRGIHIWLLLCPHVTTPYFQAWLPCWLDPSNPPLVSINLAWSTSNYYRYFSFMDPGNPKEGKFRQIYLRYQDTPHHNVTFEINDSQITETGFTSSARSQRISQETH